MKIMANICRVTALLLTIAAAFEVGVSRGVASMVADSHKSPGQAAQPRPAAAPSTGYFGDEFSDAEQALQLRPIEDPSPTF